MIAIVPYRRYHAQTSLAPSTRRHESRFKQTRLFVGLGFIGPPLTMFRNLYTFYIVFASDSNLCRKKLVGKSCTDEVDRDKFSAASRGKHLHLESGKCRTSLQGQIFVRIKSQPRVPAREDQRWGEFRVGRTVEISQPVVVVMLARSGALVRALRRRGLRKACRSATGRSEGLG